MRTKDFSVNLDLCDKLFNSLQLIENCCRFVEGKNYIMTITSARDGNHSHNSLHYIGNAIDIRSRDMINSDRVCYFDLFCFPDVRLYSVHHLRKLDALFRAYAVDNVAEKGMHFIQPYFIFFIEFNGVAVQLKCKNSVFI